MDAILGMLGGPGGPPPPGMIPPGGPGGAPPMDPAMLAQILGGPGGGAPMGGPPMGGMPPGMGDMGMGGPPSMTPEEALSPLPGSLDQVDTTSELPEDKLTRIASEVTELESDFQDEPKILSLLKTVETSLNKAITIANQEPGETRNTKEENLSEIKEAKKSSPSKKPVKKDTTEASVNEEMA